MTMLGLPFTDISHLRRRVRALAENRPAVYRMMDSTGRVIYVGKARRLRNRLLSYLRERYPEEKAARIVNAAADIQWDVMPSEFAALLGEMRQIKRFRPIFNVRMNRARNVAFIKITDGAAPKIMVGSSIGANSVGYYGPYTSAARLKDSVRVLNDLLGLRDCAVKMPVTFAGQGDFFARGKGGGCMRHEIGNCVAPCAGLVTEREYRIRVEKAAAFLETRSIEPIGEVIGKMVAAGERQDFELATCWRTRFDSLEWLLAASIRARSSIAALSFVYIDPGTHGDDRAYVIKYGTVRASAPAPHTPIEREAFDALVRDLVLEEDGSKTIPTSSIDETLLLLHWFRRHPAALSRTVPLGEWCERRSIY